MSSEQMPPETPDAEPSTPALPPSPAAASARRRGSLLRLLNRVFMLLLLGALTVAGWLGWQEYQAVQAQFATLTQTLDRVQARAQQQQNSETQLGERLQDLQNEQQRLQVQVEHNADRLGKLPGAERQDWLLAEAEYLLRMANQRLQLERDWSGALSMLQAADNVLVETRNPRMNSVRQLLAQEMLALRSAPALDRAGAVLRLQALQQQIPQLPWLPDQLAPETSAAVSVSAPDAAAPQAWYVTFWQRVSSTLHGLVRIRERSAPVAAPLTPDQQYYLQQNLHLMLEQAQVALLREQADLYHNSLQRVSSWLQDYLLVDDERTRAVQQSLQELQEWPVAPARPDISASLLKLQDVVEQQRRGTVTPLEDAA